FGCEGFEIYLKINDVEVLRIMDFHHVVSGKVGVKPSSTYGFRTCAVDFKTNVTLFSDLDNDIYDLRDFGLKEVQTTGSISASSTTLAVASATNIAVGDYLLVEIDGESGAGARGTAGVGGTWPALSYADEATMDAD